MADIVLHAPDGPTGFVRVVSNGLPTGTFVVLPDGTPIPGVISARWEISPGRVGKVTIEVEATVQASGDFAEAVLLGLAPAYGLTAEEAALAMRAAGEAKRRGSEGEGA